MLHELIAKLEDWWLVTGGADRLRNLDDRLLADIGVKREQIDEFARHGYPQEVEAAVRPAPTIAVGSPHPRIPRRRVEERTVPGVASDAGGARRREVI